MLEPLTGNLILDLGGGSGGAFKKSASSLDRYSRSTPQLTLHFHEPSHSFTGTL